MTRAYIRLDPGFFERKVLGGGYSPGEALALIGSFCLAESQTPRGRFRNERVLRALLGPFGKHVGKLKERGDITTDELGRIYVDGWDEWQEGDVTVKDRMARLRERRNKRDGGDRNPPNAPDRNPTVPLRPASLSGTVAKPDGAHDGRARLEAITGKMPEPSLGVSDDEARVFSFLARFGASIRPDSGFGRRLLGLIERRGVEEVLKAASPMARNGAMSDRQWVFGLEDALEATPSAKDARVAETAQKTSDRIFQRMMERRVEHYRASGEWPADWGPLPRELQDGAA